MPSMDQMFSPVSKGRKTVKEEILTSGKINLSNAPAYDENGHNFLVLVTSGKRISVECINSLASTENAPNAGYIVISEGCIPKNNPSCFYFTLLILADKELKQ